MKIAVVGTAEAFSEVWARLTKRVGLELILADSVEELTERDTVAVILSCGGEEDRAVERVHEAGRAGVSVPLVVGATEDHRLAVALLQRGAGGYFALPTDLELLERELADRAERAAPQDDSTLEEFQRETYDFGRMLGDDPSFKSALDRAAKVIPGGRATVLITGETGTGKELLAQAIHYNGPRASQPFVPVNCSAIPSNLLESELFGHEKGAFTDARVAKPGLFEVADGGTVFLDEVATLPWELQGKLLRVLETREVRRVGGVREKKIDVRILAAANVDLGKEVQEKRFREDLYYRLAVVTIRLPALRERGDDPVLLARHFLAELSSEYGLDAADLRQDAIAAIRRHPWPGNVRELRNAVERALLLSGGRSAGAADLALELYAAPGPGRTATTGSNLPFPATLSEIERAAARAAVHHCDGNKSEAARMLGTTRTRLYRLLKDAAEPTARDA